MPGTRFPWTTAVPWDTRTRMSCSAELLRIVTDVGGSPVQRSSRTWTALNPAAVFASQSFSIKMFESGDGELFTKPHERMKMSCVAQFQNFELRMVRLTAAPTCRHSL